MRISLKVIEKVMADQDLVHGDDFHVPIEWIVIAEKQIAKAKQHFTSHSDDSCILSAIAHAAACLAQCLEQNLVVSEKIQKAEQEERSGQAIPVFPSTITTPEYDGRKEGSI